MATLNLKKKSPASFTHEGALAVNINKEQQLRRTVMACMLWEDSFYESGISVAERIQTLVHGLRGDVVAKIASEARNKMKLRHVPLLLARELARHPKESERQYVADILFDVIQRPDELAEYLAIYWKDGKETLSAQSKKGLARAFTKFDEYSLAKYNREGAVKLRDVLFLSHAKPARGQKKLFKAVVDGTLKTPDTWEVALSAGKDKAKTFTRLIKEEQLGALALLRNLRNMEQSGVSPALVKKALSEMNVSRVLPFRFISAAQHAPSLEPELEQAMFRALEGVTKLPGKTVLIIDVSGSMGGQISDKSTLDRTDAAASVAMLLREVSDDISIYCTAGSGAARGHETALIPARRGFALRDAVRKAKDELGGGGIFLTQVMDYVYKHEPNPDDVDRVIVITDEADCERDPNKAASKAHTFGVENYLINIAAYQSGIGYGKWTHIDGWSESVVRYIQANEEQ